MTACVISFSADRGDLAVQQRPDQCPLAVGRQVRAGKRGPQVGLRRHHPAEPEQLVFEVVQLAWTGPPRSPRPWPPAPRPRSARSRGADQRLATRPAIRSSVAAETLPVSSDRISPALASAVLAGSVSARRRRVLGVQQRGHGEQVVAESVGRRLVRGHGGELIAGLRQGGSARAPHQLTPAFPSSSCCLALVS